MLSTVPFKCELLETQSDQRLQEPLLEAHLSLTLAKQLLKLSAVAIIIYTTISGNLGLFAQVGQSSPAYIVALTFDVIFSIAWKFGLFLVVVGLLDYAYERWQLEENLKMTKQEVKDEWKQSEGNPEAKAHSNAGSGNLHDAA